MVYETPAVYGPYFVHSEHLQILLTDEEKKRKKPPKYLTYNILQK